MRRRLKKGGFTLIEMLVVIGIIGVLMGALMGAYGFVQKMAWQTQAQTLVSDAATALALYLNKEGEWPEEIANGNGEFDEDVCLVLQKYNLLEITAYKKNDKGEWVINENSPDRYGLLDPWGRRKLKGNPNLKGDEITKHRLQLRVDTDGDGKIDGPGIIPQGATIRAPAIVWSRGPSGKDEGNDGQKRYPNENRLSWAFGK